MATAIEYGLIAALVAVAGIGAASTLGDKVKKAQEPVQSTWNLERTITPADGSDDDVDVVDHDMTLGDCFDKLTFLHPYKTDHVYVSFSCHKTAVSN